jgi:hypothetical protein
MAGVVIPTSAGQLQAVINDVRPAGSPPLTWYLKFVAEFVDSDLVTGVAPKEEQLKPSSWYSMRAPAHSGTSFRTFNVPEDREAFAVIPGIWQVNGSVSSPHGSHSDRALCMQCARNLHIGSVRSSHCGVWIV